MLSNKHNPWRMLGLAILIVAIVLMAIYGRQWFPWVKELVSQGGTMGFLIFMVAFVILTSLCFPVSVLGFTAGVLYGPWWGLLLLCPSGLLSGMLMFFLGRTLLRGFVHDLIQRNEKLAAIENVAGDQALRLNVLTRLSPFNYGLASYALAVGKSSFKAYLVGISAIFPSLVAQVWVGTLAGKTGEFSQNGFSENRLEFVLLILGVLFFVVLSWQVGKMVKRALISVDSPSDP